VKHPFTMRSCSISFGLAMAGSFSTKRKRVIQWLTVAMLPRPPTSSISLSMSCWFTLLMMKPQKQRGEMPFLP